MSEDFASSVGIGTTSPLGKLRVAGGQISADQYIVTSGNTVDFNNGNVQVLQSVGNVGITLNNMVDRRGLHPDRYRRHHAHLHLHQLHNLEVRAGQRSYHRQQKHNLYDLEGNYIFDY